MLLPTKAIDTVITDEGIDRQTENLLRESEVQIVKVKGMPNDLEPDTTMKKT